MDEGRKRVLLIVASTLAARRLAAWDGRTSPLMESAIADAITLAERILQKIDARWPQRQESLKKLATDQKRADSDKESASTEARVRNRSRTGRNGLNYLRCEPGTCGLLLACALKCGVPRWESSTANNHAACDPC